MNILLIGNGFDLAHGLPTKYTYFLEFCKRVARIYSFPINTKVSNYFEKYIFDIDINEELIDILKEAVDNRSTINKDISVNPKYTTKNIFLDEFYECIRDNTWIEYFLECYLNVGNNWIDFEAEISRVIQSLDEAMIAKRPGIVLPDIKEEIEIFLTLVYGQSTEGILKKKLETITSWSNFVVLLDAELGRLIRALEIYIAEFVSRVSIANKNIDIEKLNIDHVLSFNYSDTYERIYCKEKEIKCDYIHGKADINKNVNTSNLVLGIDEYLGDDRKDKEFNLLSFKKFYQRIYKSTGNMYLNWVDEIKDEYRDYIDPNMLSSSKGYPGHTLYIFGHSLDVTDRDVLKMFICNDNVQTKIFYYRKNQEDKTELGKLIRNLIMIMGQEELIRRTGGIHKTIEFIPQTL